MEVVAASALSDLQFASALALVQHDEVAIDAGTEPITAQELQRHIADDRTDGNIHERDAVVEGETVLAFSHLDLEQDHSNLHFASCEIAGVSTHPEAAEVALRMLLARCDQLHRSSLLGWGPNTDAEAAFWIRAGASLAYTEQMSQLDVTRVDPALMQLWVDGRMDRAADVRLLKWAGSCPDEHLEAFAVSNTAMNDAPLDGIEMNDFEMDSQDVRNDEDALRSLGLEPRTLFAIAPDGSPVGHTQVNVNPLRPNASWQWDTVVLAEHRERGIGRWLKAEMWQWLRREVPHVQRVLTGNAESNEAMLAINVAMGFTPAQVFGAWQAPVSTMRETLG